MFLPETYRCGDYNDTFGMNFPIIHVGNTPALAHEYFWKNTV